MGYRHIIPSKISDLSNIDMNKKKRIIIIDHFIKEYNQNNIIYFIDESSVKIELNNIKRWTN